MYNGKGNVKTTAHHDHDILRRTNNRWRMFFCLYLANHVSSNITHNVTSKREGIKYTLYVHWQRVKLWFSEYLPNITDNVTSGREGILYVNIQYTLYSGKEWNFDFPRVVQISGGPANADRWVPVGRPLPLNLDWGSKSHRHLDIPTPLDTLTTPHQCITTSLQSKGWSS